MDRFWSKVDKAGPVPPGRPGLGPCWVWAASRNPHGYGRFGSEKAHRVAYVLVRGPIPAGLELDHVCRNTSCVNPLHLEAVTHAVNVARGRLGETNAARGAAQTHCKRGHVFDSKNTSRISASGRRSCRTCVNQAQKARYRARKAA